MSTPPRTRPTDAPPPAIAPKIPNAFGRSGDPANVTVKSPSADGASSAPNMPWRARADTSISKLCAFPPIAETLDFSLISVEAGKAVFQSTPQFKHYNPLGSVHGGWYATLLDSALGCAVQSTLPVGYSYTTVELGMNIVRAASSATGPLRATASVVHSGRQLATAEARIVGADDRLYAHGTTTCLVFEVPTR